MSQIKAIITDVDGVMVGKQEGVNFPLPHTDDLLALERLSANGVPVILCTAKFGHAIEDIALRAKLNNPHITDGGAVIIDWLDNKIVSQHTIDTAIAVAYLQSSIDKNIYTELYTVDNYYIQKSQLGEFTKRRSKVIQSDPIVVDSLADTATEQDVIKVISFSEGEEDKPRLQEHVAKFADKVTYIWSQHPYLMPRGIVVITALGVSKKHAAEEVAKFLGVDFDSILGIGDSEADWGFMQLCGYVATVGQNGGKLQELAKSKGQGRYYYGSSVDEHGILDIFKRFGLTQD